MEEEKETKPNNGERGGREEKEVEETKLYMEGDKRERKGGGKQNSH